MNAYVEILKFGSKGDAITFESLFQFITKSNLTFNQGHPVTEHNTILKNIFKNSFQDWEGNSPKDDFRGTYFLKPEALAYLLNHEALELAKGDSAAARKEALESLRQATKATWIAIISLIITAGLAIVQIYTN